MAGIPLFVKPTAIGAILSSSHELAGQEASLLGEFQYAGLTWCTPALDGVTALITGDFGSAQAVNFAAVLGANAQAGTTWRFTMDDSATAVYGSTPQYDSGVLPFIAPGIVSGSGFGGASTGGFDFRSPGALFNGAYNAGPIAVPSTTATPARATYNSFLDIGATVTRRYWSLRISGHSGAFQAPFLIMGTKVQGSRYYEPTWGSGPADQSTISVSRNGVPDIAVGAMLRTLTLTLGWTTEIEFETQFGPLALALGKTLPAYCCFDPDAGPYRQNRTYYGRAVDSGRNKRDGWNRFSRDYEILSMI